MQNSINPQKAGFVLGGAMGLFHVGWAVLVATGFAQPLLDCIFRLHMLKPVYVVLPFSVEYAIGLVVVTALVGFVVGNVLGMLWNAVHKA